MATIYQDKQGRSVYNYNGQVIDAKTGQPVENSTPQLNTSAPSSVGASTKTQPTLSGFNETMSNVINLAREKRNKLALETFGSNFASGTFKASDFGSILSNLNKSSDTRVQDMLDTQAEGTGQLTSETVGNFEVLRDSTGKIVSTRSTGSSASEDKDQDFKDAKQVLDASKGSDGYVNTEVYVAALSAWPAGADDFFKRFPPGIYVNPDDPTVPDFIYYKTFQQ